MKIALLSDVNSSHTVKWANGLTRIGHSVCIFSFSDKLPTTTYDGSCHVVAAGIAPVVVSGRGGMHKFITYLSCIPRLKAFLRANKPDVVHAHYLTSYGFLSTMASHPRLLMSAWGSDVLVFPGRSAFRRRFLQHVTDRAMFLTASSVYLAHALEKLVCRPVEVVPFGIEPEDFAVRNQVNPFPSGSVVIGTVKTFEPTYGLEVLVEAFIKMRSGGRYGHVKLVLVGEGGLRASLSKRLHDAGFSKECLLPGKVPQGDVPKWHHLIDIFVSPSISESFGVSVVEAMTAGKPIVASDIPPFRELLGNSRGGLLFPVGDVDSLLAALLQMVDSPDLRQELGRNAQVRATTTYRFERNLRKMEEIYIAMLAKGS
jgi:glycosyltransferase involved in cell wall biosynthesis